MCFVKTCLKFLMLNRKECFLLILVYLKIVCALSRISIISLGLTFVVGINREPKFATGLVVILSFRLIKTFEGPKFYSSGIVLLFNAYSILSSK